jgi:hypothetical protein
MVAQGVLGVGVLDVVNKLQVLQEVLTQVAGEVVWVTVQPHHKLLELAVLE